MMNLLTEVDLDWVADIIDVVEQNAGKPWRVALERFDDRKRATARADVRRFDAVVGAVQRLCGGRLRNTKIARRARSLVLGHPVFTAEHRGERIGHAALMLGTPPRKLLVRIVLPAALPYVFNGLRVGLGIAWVLVIVSEMLAVKGGIGYAMWTAYQFVRIDLIIAAMFTMGLLGLVSDRLLLLLSRRLLRWNTGLRAR